MNTTPLQIAQRQRDEFRSERDAAMKTVEELTSLLCQVESALIDAPATAEVRLARMRVNAAIAKATGSVA